MIFLRFMIYPCPKHLVIAYSSVMTLLKCQQLVLVLLSFQVAIFTFSICSIHLWYLSMKMGLANLRILACSPSLEASKSVI